MRKNDILKKYEKMYSETGDYQLRSQVDISEIHGFEVSEISGYETLPDEMNIKERSFSVDEAIRIKLNLFPEMDMLYLFKKDDNDTTNENKTA